MYKLLTFILLATLSFTFTCADQTSDQVTEEKTSTQYYHVGELGKLWQYPSDHLVIGATVGNIHFVSWNILHSGALHHIIRNDQGLRESLILESNVPLQEGDSLTVREALIIQNIMEMIVHPTHPRSLIALEETSERVFEEIQKLIPENMVMAPSLVEDLDHGDIFIYDSNIFEFVDLKKVHYEVHPGNTYMTLTLKEKATGLIYRFAQSHVPGGPINSAPARKELTEALLKDFDPEAITILMGDMNRSPDYFTKDFEIAAGDQGLQVQPFVNLWIPYATHINTHLEASWIDNLFISNPFPEVSVTVSSKGSEFYEGLQPTIDLLETLRP